MHIRKKSRRLSSAASNLNFLKSAECDLGRSTAPTVTSTDRAEAEYQHRPSRGFRNVASKRQVSAVAVNAGDAPDDLKSVLHIRRDRQRIVDRQRPTVRASGDLAEIRRPVEQDVRQRELVRAHGEAGRKIAASQTVLRNRENERVVDRLRAIMCTIVGAVPSGDDIRKRCRSVRQ